MNTAFQGFTPGMGVFGGCGYGACAPGQTGGERPSRGERIIARLDADQDGALSIAELAESRRGRQMTLERFAAIDANGDARLDAAEIDAMRRGRGGDAGREADLRARHAEYLAARVAPAPSTDVAAQVIGLLDADGSGRLNSEEIAGTHLAELIGGDFYRLDADRNGGLDQQELAALLVAQLAGEPADNAPADPPAVQGYEEGLQTAFDTALLLLSADDAPAPADVVASLYGAVRTVLGMH